MREREREGREGFEGGTISDCHQVKLDRDAPVIAYLQHER